VPRAFRHAACLLALALAACGDGSRSAGPARAPADFPADAQLAWQGLLACADCRGIDTRLRLLRAGDATRYELVEAFIADDGTEYFREEGRWSREGRVLRLQADAGGERLYALDADGSLHVIDRLGHEAGSGRLLEPVAGAIHP